MKNMMTTLNYNLGLVSIVVGAIITGFVFGMMDRIGMIHTTQETIDTFIIVVGYIGGVLIMTLSWYRLQYLNESKWLAFLVLIPVVRYLAIFYLMLPHRVKINEARNEKMLQV